MKKPATDSGGYLPPSAPNGNHQPAVHFFTRKRTHHKTKGINIPPYIKKSLKTKTRTSKSSYTQKNKYNRSK